MARENTNMPPTADTEDAPPEGWLAWSRGHTPRELSPRLRLLVHSDLDRIGWISVPGAVPADGAWLTVGRNEPFFAGLGAGAARAIDDPHVSRDQLRVRWLAAPSRFEVEPSPNARRSTSYVDLAEGSEGAAAEPITRATLLEPGSCVAIGDRVLLALDLGVARPPAADRLGLVGESDVLWALREEIRSVARFGRSALAVGPTGAGKELVARALHHQSPRAAGPFVAVNCAALPQSLAESVLFGHKKGAFTGADADEKGVFRAADGGTLFFDELGELPLALQPKLLRVLQDGIVVPIGAQQGRRVDVRIVAATHRDLEAFVRAGKLREDLYHRLSTHVLHVPSLAARRTDIPELFVHMLERLRAEHAGLSWLWTAGREWRAALPIGFVVELMRRAWTGNVRELANLAERTARVNLEPGAFRAPEVMDARSSRRSATATSEPRDGIVDTGESGTPTPPTAPTPVSGQGSNGSALAAMQEAVVRAAGAALGIARKTLLKLLTPATLIELAAEADRLGVREGERAKRLRASAAEALLTRLEAHEFNQSAVAASLGASRTTLIKLMEDLGLPRATDLDAADIERAREHLGGDLDAAARVLRVSASALRKRVSQLAAKRSD